MGEPEAKPAKTGTVLGLLFAALVLVALLTNNRGCGCISVTARDASDKVWNDRTSIDATIKNPTSKSVTLYIDGNPNIFPPGGKLKVHFPLRTEYGDKKSITGQINDSPFAIYLRKPGVIDSMSGWELLEKPEFEGVSNISGGSGNNTVANGSSTPPAAPPSDPGASSGLSFGTDMANNAKTETYYFDYTNTDLEHQRIVHTSSGPQYVGPGAKLRLWTLVSPTDKVAVVTVEEKDNEGNSSFTTHKLPIPGR